MGGVDELDVEAAGEGGYAFPDYLGHFGFGIPGFQEGFAVEEECYRRWGGEEAEVVGDEGADVAGTEDVDSRGGWAIRLLVGGGVGRDVVLTSPYLGRNRVVGAFDGEARWVGSCDEEDGAEGRREERHVTEDICMKYSQVERRDR